MHTLLQLRLKSPHLGSRSHQVQQCRRYTSTFLRGGLMIASVFLSWSVLIFQDACFSGKFLVLVRSQWNVIRLTTVCQPEKCWKRRCLGPSLYLGWAAWHPRKASSDTYMAAEVEYYSSSPNSDHPVHVIQRAGLELEASSLIQTCPFCPAPSPWDFWEWLVWWGKMRRGRERWCMPRWDALCETATWARWRLTTW